jgi:hypothetical protein
MLIYHGSYTKVEHPEIRVPNRNHDFGVGFYVTANEEQAVKYAQIVYNRQGGVPTVSCYEFDYEAAKQSLCIKSFDSPDGEWFDFVCNKRMGQYTGDEYDLIYGPVANDKVYLCFAGFLAGTLTREETLRKLNNNKLYSQFTFCNEKALSFIKFVSSREVAVNG